MYKNIFVTAFLFLQSIYSLANNNIYFLSKSDADKKNREEESREWKKQAREGKRALKILAVGNSWTQNSTNYLGKIMDNLGLDGKKIFVE